METGSAGRATMRARVRYGGPRAGRSHSFGHTLTEQAGGLDDEDPDQDREHDHVLPLARHVAGGVGLEKSDQEASGHGSRNIADAAQYGGGECTQPEQEAKGELDLDVIDAEH